VSDACIVALVLPQVNSGITDFLKLFPDWRLSNENTGNLFFLETQRASRIASAGSPNAAWRAYDGPDFMVAAHS